MNLSRACAAVAQAWVSLGPHINCKLILIIGSELGHMGQQNGFRHSQNRLQDLALSMFVSLLACRTTTSKERPELHTSISACSVSTSCASATLAFAIASSFKFELSGRCHCSPAFLLASSCPVLSSR